MPRAESEVPTFVRGDGRTITLRTDRYYEPIYGYGTVVWRRTGWPDASEHMWCVYGCPSRPWTLTDYGDHRVLWGACQHPIDLSDGAAERHAAAYPERVRRQVFGDLVEPAEGLSESPDLPRRGGERGSLWSRLKRLMTRAASRW